MKRECVSPQSTLLKPTPCSNMNPLSLFLGLAFASVLMVRCPWIQATTKLLNLPTRGGLGPGLGGRAGANGDGGMNTDKWVVGPFSPLRWGQGPLQALPRVSPIRGHHFPRAPAPHWAHSFSWWFPPSSRDTLSPSLERPSHCQAPSHKQPLGRGSPWGAPAQPHPFLASVTSLSAGLRALATPPSLRQSPLHPLGEAGWASLPALHPKLCPQPQGEPTSPGRPAQSQPGRS